MPKTHRSHRPHAAASPPIDLEDRIRTRAYQLYVERNTDPGHDLDDWLRAEQEVRTTLEPHTSEH
jgi:hypothetical protein